MNPDGDLIPTVVEVMRDPVDRGQQFGVAHRDRALGLRLAIVPLVYSEAAASGSEHRPAVGVRMLRVLSADRPEQHSRI